MKVVALLLVALLALISAFLAPHVAADDAPVVTVNVTTPAADVVEPGWYFILQYWDFCDHTWNDLWWGVHSFNGHTAKGVVLGSSNTVDHFNWSGVVYIAKCSKHTTKWCLYLIKDLDRYWANKWTPHQDWTFGRFLKRLPFSKLGSFLKTGSKWLVWSPRPCHGNSFEAKLAFQKKKALKIRLFREYEWFHTV